VKKVFEKPKKDSKPTKTVKHKPPERLSAEEKDFVERLKR
jgi:hypothetical protein